MKMLYGRFDQVDKRLNQWLVHYSVALLRISLGAVFFGFGVLKFFPNVSPAQDIAGQTTAILTLGLVPLGAARIALATLECVIGLSFITGKFLRITVWLLGVELIGILSPVVLLPGKLFTGPFHAPNLTGQYVLKDVILAAAGMVIAATLRGGRLVTVEEASRTVVVRVVRSTHRSQAHKGWVAMHREPGFLHARSVGSSESARTKTQRRGSAPTLVRFSSDGEGTHQFLARTPSVGQYGTAIKLVHPTRK